MEIKQFIDEQIESSNTIKNFTTTGRLLERMIELEAIENWMNLMYGVELDIQVKPAERKEGRFYGTGFIGELMK